MVSGLLYNSWSSCMCQCSIGVYLMGGGGGVVNEQVRLM